MVCQSRLVALLAVCLSALLPACKSADPSPVVGSVKKLGGAPARVLKLAFAGDGKSVFALERRSSEAGSFGAEDKYAITRRGVAGGESKDLAVLDREIIDLAPLGESVVVLDRQRLPPSVAEIPGEPKERRELRALLDDRRDTARRETTVFLASAGEDPKNLLPEDTRCFHVVGAAGGQYVALSFAKGPGKQEWPEEALVRVLGTKPGEQTTLARTGIAYDLSADGAWVLIRHKYANGVPKTYGDAPFFDATAVSLVDVKANNTVPLPGSLVVDGAELKTDKLAVNFAGDGLVFQSEAGEVIRSALDGSKAVRVAAALPEGNPTAAAAGTTGAAPSGSAAAPASAPASVSGAGPIRVLDRRGVVLEMREEGGAVEVARAAVDKEHPKTEIARLEGGLAGLGPMAVDATGTRIAFAVVSDTSRDGVIDRIDDDAAVFVSDPVKGSMSLERGQIVPLADEIVPKIAAALTLAPGKVAIVHAGKKLEVTVELPWVEGEKAPALVDRWMVAGRALQAIVPAKQAIVRLRVGPFEARLARQEEGGIQPYSAILVLGMVFRDPAALPLVLHDPTLTTIAGGSYARVLSGVFENTGKTPLGPFEVVVTAKPYPGSTKLLQVRPTFGPIEPGKKLPYKIPIWEERDGVAFDVEYSAGGKSIKPLNALLLADGLDMLDIALAIQAEHKATLQNDYADSFELSIVRVKLAESHLAMPEAARVAMMEKIQRAIAKHFRKFHPDDKLTLLFHSPSGGGWGMNEGQRPTRFEVDKTMERP